MKTQFEYIQKLSKQYQISYDQPETLYKDLKELSEDTLTNVFNEYAEPDRKFSPVALLRAEVARRILQGETISEAITEEIKEKIRSKDKTYFPSYGNRLMGEMDTKDSKSLYL